MGHLVVDAVEDDEGEEAVVDLLLVGLGQGLTVPLLQLLIVFVLHNLDRCKLVSF